MPVDINELRSIMNTIQNQAAVPKVEEPVRPKRCEHTECNKKLMLTDYACQCKQFYCSNHRHANIHSCKFDYKNKAEGVLGKQLVKLGAEKMERI